MGCIYAAIPLARRIQKLVTETVGREAFGYAVIVVFAVGLVLGLRRLLRTGTAYLWLRGLFLLLVAGAFTAMTVGLWDSPEEAVHFVQYGVLGVLMYRLVRYVYIHDRGDIPVAMCLCMLVGFGDEIIQWTVADRFFDYRDIFINCTGSCLVILAHGVCFRSPNAGKGFSRNSFRSLVRILMVILVVFGATLFNTPQRVERYAAKVSWLGFLSRNPSDMNDFGWWIQLKDHPIRFKSRFKPEELLEIDRTKGEQKALILDKFKGRKAYYNFLSLYTPGVDPFVHEARVHLFRRDSFRDRLADREVRSDPKSRGEACYVALSEHRILQAFFSNTVASAAYYQIRADDLEYLQKHAAKQPYASPVSRNLVTIIDQPTLLVLLVGLLAILVYMDRNLSSDPAA